MNDALKRQEGGNHYKDLAIQPVEYIHANGIGYFEGNVIKYVTRWRDKGGIQDLRKARHYLDLLIDLQAPRVPKDAIEWHGGPCPLAAGTRVQVWFDDGTIYVTDQPTTLVWSRLDPSGKPTCGEIIAYKIL